ncbi:hypothetical protein [Saccharothrix xinjiangensis]|uniref:Uncharacterized protein n=1 Tax=Saccharothrix xinjiangensis TaxID=204798 RepID=A0ABV9Y9D7_9PSEU
METFPVGEINTAIDVVRGGRARYRAVVTFEDTSGQARETPAP